MSLFLFCLYCPTSLPSISCHFLSSCHSHLDLFYISLSSCPFTLFHFHFFYIFLPPFLLQIPCLFYFHPSFAILLYLFSFTLSLLIFFSFPHLSLLLLIFPFLPSLHFFSDMFSYFLSFHLPSLAALLHLISSLPGFPFSFFPPHISLSPFPDTIFRIFSLSFSSAFIFFLVFLPTPFHFIYFT